MTEQTKTRCYSVTMALLNTSLTFFFYFMSKLNADAGWPNVLISLLGPAMTLLFLTIAVAWSLDALRPGSMRAFVPGGREPPDSMFTSLCQSTIVPTPLPPSISERCWTSARRLVTPPKLFAKHKRQAKAI